MQVSFKAGSHRAKANAMAKKIKEQSEFSNIKENFRYRIHFSLNKPLGPVCTERKRTLKDVVFRCEM